VWQRLLEVSSIPVPDVQGFYLKNRQLIDAARTAAPAAIQPRTVMTGQPLEGFLHKVIDFLELGEEA
jgi:hypothetical protein